MVRSGSAVTQITVNRCVETSLSFACIEDLFARLAGGSHFAKFDLVLAYQKLPLDDQSKQLLVVNTPKQITISVYMFTIRGIHSSSHFSFSQGSYSARSTCSLLFR